MPRTWNKDKQSAFRNSVDGIRNSEESIAHGVRILYSLPSALCTMPLRTHYSTIPLFQHSNCERSELSSLWENLDSSSN